MLRLSLSTALLCCAAAPLRAAVSLDIALDGLDLGGSVQTSLLGATRSIDWTKVDSDDCFLTLDATLLETIGFTLEDENGAVLAGKVPARNGLRLRVGADLQTCISGWELLRRFDDNLDGKIDAVDRIWIMIDLFMDANAAGPLVDSELHRP